MTYETPVAAPAPATDERRTAPLRGHAGGMSRPRGVVVTVIVALLALAWLFPLLWAVINSFR